MTSTSVIALSVSSASAKAPAPSSAQPSGDGPAFRDVLANQSSPPTANQAPAKNSDGQGNPVSSGNDASTQAAGHPAKPEQAGKTTDDKKADDKKPIADASASASATGLPSIALYIAAEANAPVPRTVSSDEAHTPEGTQGAEATHAATPAPGRARPGSTAATAGTGETPLPATIDTTASTSASKQSGASSGNGATGPLTATNPLEASAARGKDRSGQPLEPKDAASHATSFAVASHASASAHPAPEPGKSTRQTLDAVTARMPSTHTGSNPTSSPNAPLFAAQAIPTHTLMAATAPATGPAITIPLQNPRWPTELGRQFVAIAQSSQPGLGHTAQLRLDPPNLGPLHIAIHVSDNVAQAVFFSPHAQVRQAVENALPQLQQQLAQAGIALGQTSVSDQGASRQAFGDDSPSSRKRATGATTTVAMATGQPMTTGTRASVQNGLVDTFA